MELAAFVERLRSDADFAERVRRDPDAAFDEAELDADDRRRVRRIIAGVGSFTEFFES